MASSAENALSAFEILPDGSASWLFNKDAGTTTAMNSLSDLHLFGLADKQYISFSAHRASAAATCIVKPDGGLGGLRLSGSGTAAYSNFSNQDSIATSAGTFVYASRWDEPGLQWFQLTSAGKLVRKGGYADKSRDLSAQTLPTLKQQVSVRASSFSPRRESSQASRAIPLASRGH